MSLPPHYTIRRLSFSGQTDVSSLGKKDEDDNDRDEEEDEEQQQENRHTRLNTKADPSETNTRRHHQHSRRDTKDSWQQPSVHTNDDSTNTASTTTSATSKKQDRSTGTATIALFGGHGKTGQHFLRLALDAGYRVRALLPVGCNDSSTAQTKQHHQHSTTTNLGRGPGENINNNNASSYMLPSSLVRQFQGSLQDATQVKRVIRGADFVVCLLNDTLPSKKQDYTHNTLDNFMRLLHPLLNQQRSVQVFLYQVCVCVMIVWSGWMAC
jgi:hypothetical protein